MQSTVCDITSNLEVGQRVIVMRACFCYLLKIANPAIFHSQTLSELLFEYEPNSYESNFLLSTQDSKSNHFFTVRLCLSCFVLMDLKVMRVSVCYLLKIANPAIIYSQTLSKFCACGPNSYESMFLLSTQDS